MGLPKHFWEDSHVVVCILCSPEQARWLGLLLDMVSPSRPLHLMHWCIQSFPLIALVEWQRQNLSLPVHTHPAVTVTHFMNVPCAAHKLYLQRVKQQHKFVLFKLCVAFCVFVFFRLGCMCCRCMQEKERQEPLPVLHLESGCAGYCQSSV